MPPFAPAPSAPIPPPPSAPAPPPAPPPPPPPLANDTVVIEVSSITIAMIINFLFIIISFNIVFLFFKKLNYNSKPTLKTCFIRITIEVWKFIKKKLPDTKKNQKTGDHDVSRSGLKLYSCMDTSIFGCKKQKPFIYFNSYNWHCILLLSKEIIWKIQKEGWGNISRVVQTNRIGIIGRAFNARSCPYVFEDTTLIQCFSFDRFFERKECSQDS
jgi:hypothetical protein